MNRLKGSVAHPHVASADLLYRTVWLQNATIVSLIHQCCSLNEALHMMNSGLMT